jgi:hypothetical protein
VIVENIEELPELPLLFVGAGTKGIPAPPPPTVIGYAVAPQTENEHEVLNPPAPPPPPVEPPPPPPPATTA